MRIALDFDDTYDKDPFFWNDVVKNAKSRGHEVRFVTMRHEQEGADVEEAAEFLGIDIIYTGRKQKRPFCAALNFFPDVWIDDSPEFIVAR